jgi:NAD(P)-dependent dehydrogenase (short-subunit alcohol dehydrogenase family)
VITGSSGGIGSALVDTFLSDNYFVVGIDSTSSKRNLNHYVEINGDLRQFAKDDHYGEKILTQIKNLVPDTLDNFVLINNAAVQILKPISDLKWEDWDNAFTVNTIAPFILAKGLMEELIATHGHIINISSIHSKLTKPNFSCYASSKSALESLTRSLALELSPKGVSVNAIAPAAISTEMLKDGFRAVPDKIAELESYHPSGSIGSPVELANLAKNITLNKGGFLTGSIIDFSGGISGCLSDPAEGDEV